MPRKFIPFDQYLAISSTSQPLVTTLHIFLIYHLSSALECKLSQHKGGDVRGFAACYIPYKSSVRHMTGDQCIVNE